MSCGDELRDGALERAMDVLGWSGSHVEIADSFGTRLLGLIGRSPMTPEGDAVVLVFPGCAAVHTCFMGYALDIAFIDEEGAVLSLRQGIAPWRFLSCPGAAAVIERASLVENMIGVRCSQALSTSILSLYSLKLHKEL